MANKRQYVLTAKQQKKATSLYKGGATSLTKLQSGLRKAKIPASRQSISSWMQKSKKGKRAPSPFWKDVKLYKEKSGRTHKQATLEVKSWKEWGEKRAAKIIWTDKKGVRHVGKKWKSHEERSKSMREIRESIDLTDEQRTALNEKELGEFYYGDTPH